VDKKSHKKVSKKLLFLRVCTAEPILVFFFVIFLVGVGGREGFYSPIISLSGGRGVGGEGGRGEEAGNDSQQTYLL
jgi:hypothetical protein